YTYPLTEDGADPERAAFQWYHDHRCSLTARNVWRGLAGMFIIDDDVERALPLPRGGRDIPLMIADRTFDRHNQLTNPFGAGGHPPDDGVSGRRVLVNGAHRPHHAVDACRYRLRILNASHFRSYNLELSNGRPLTQIAGDSGLLPAPVERRRILVGPAERVEVVADFGHDAGRSVVLRSVRTERGKTLPGLAPPAAGLGGERSHRARAHLEDHRLQGLLPQVADQRQALRPHARGRVADARPGARVA